MTSHADDRFVAHFDMLGMSALTVRDPDLAWQILSAFRVAINDRMHLVIERLDTKEVIADRVQCLMFSDTLIAFSTGPTENDAVALLTLTTELFTRALHYRLPLRGGIAHGRFTVAPALNLFSGPALVDAYHLGESSQWLGVVVDDKTAEAAKNSPLRAKGGKDAIVRWEVPVKNGPPVSRSVVNWVETHRHTYTGPVPLTVEIFYALMSDISGPWETLSPDIQRKYVNTVEFFNTHYSKVHEETT